MLPESALHAIENEYDKAEKQHGEMASAHEGYAVILEEMDELWTEIKKKDPWQPNIVKEASQVGAMALRFLIDLC